MVHRRPASDEVKGEAVSPDWHYSIDITYFVGPSVSLWVDVAS